jgi:hypothetical protein
MTGKPEVACGQPGGPEVGFEEIATDFREARLWIVSVRSTTRPESAKAGSDYFRGES